METQGRSYLLRSHLLRMAMLTQRAVDYSIKAHQLGSIEIYRLFWKHDQDWRDLQRCIGSRGRVLVAAGIPAGLDSSIIDRGLRIYSALHVTYTAACEIADAGSLLLENGRATPSPRLAEMGNFINGLVRLCTVAMFKQDVRHTRTNLQDHRSWRWFELALCHTLRVLVQSSDQHAAFELEIARALGQIAEQSFDIGQGLTTSIEEETVPAHDWKTHLSRHTRETYSTGVLKDLHIQPVRSSHAAVPQA